MKIKVAAVVVVVLLLALSSTWLAKERNESARIAKTIGPFVNERTVLIGRMDMSQFDLEAIWAKTIERIGAREEGKGEEVTEPIKLWKEQFIRAGGKEVYFVVSFEETMGENILGVVPLEKGADAEALGNLLRYGSAEAPEGAANGIRINHGPFGGTQAEVIRGALVLGQEKSLAKIRESQPADRPELAKALAEGSQANVQIVIIPNDVLRGMIGMALPDMLVDVGVEADTEAVAAGLLWQSIALNGPPTMSLNIVIQSRDEGSAKAMGDLLTNMFAVIRAKVAELNEWQRPGISTSWAAVMGMFRPIVEKNQVTMGLDGEQLNRLIFDILMPSVSLDGEQINKLIFDILTPSVVETHSVSAINLKGIAIACFFMHADDDQGGFPANLEVLVENGYLPDRTYLANPRQPERKNGYVYIRPSWPMDTGEQPGQTIMIYEAHDEWGEGVNVCFADGHVEFIADEERFKKLLAETTENVDTE